MGGDGFIGELILNRGDDILPIMYCLSPDTLVNWYFVAILKFTVRMYYHQALFLSHLDKHNLGTKLKFVCISDGKKYKFFVNSEKCLQ